MFFFFSQLLIIYLHCFQNKIQNTDNLRHAVIDSVTILNL